MWSRLNADGLAGHFVAHSFALHVAGAGCQYSLSFYINDASLPSEAGKVHSLNTVL
jgi:hypothetical protein